MRKYYRLLRRKYYIYKANRELKKWCKKRVSYYDGDFGMVYYVKNVNTNRRLIGDEL